MSRLQTTLRASLSLLGAALVAVSSSQAAVVTQYSFESNLLDTGTSSTVADTLSGLNASGGAQTPVYIPGVVGQGVMINRSVGNTASLFAADSADLDLPGAFTIEAFVNPTSTGTPSVFQRLALKWGPGGNAHHFGIQGADGNDVNYHHSGALVGSGGTVVPGVWQHLAVVGDGVNTIRLYRDGALVATGTYSGTTTNSSEPFTIGQRNADVLSAGNQYYGGVDEVMLHNSSSTQAYIRSRAQLLSPNAANPTTGLVNFYQFEGNGSDTAALYRANVGTTDNNLSIAGPGTVTFVPGIVGQAADLSGGAYLRTPLTADVNLPTSFTIEGWINPDAITGSFQRIALNWGPEQSYHFGLLGNDVNLFINETDGNDFQVASGGDVVAGEWQHIAAVLNGVSNTATVYLNGVAVGSGNFDGTLFQALSEGLGIGDSFSTPSSGLAFRGLVDEFAFWRTALTADQIRTHYLAFGSGYNLSLVPEPSSVLLWSLFPIVALGLCLRRRKSAAQE